MRKCIPDTYGSRQFPVVDIILYCYDGRDKDEKSFTIRRFGVSMYGNKAFLIK